MTLATQIAADVSDVFLNTSDFATTITYQRGGATLTLTALVGVSEFEVVESFGITRMESRDYMIEPSELDFGHGVTLPQRGDVITEGANKYIVSAPAGAPVFVYADENRTLLSVHTTMQSGT